MAKEPFSEAYRIHLGPKYASSFKDEALWPAFGLIKHLDHTLVDAQNVKMSSVGGRNGRGTDVTFELASKPGFYFGGSIDFESSFDLFESGPVGHSLQNWTVHVSKQPLRIMSDDEDTYMVGGSLVKIKETATELYAADDTSS